ncbi:hypothetical protein ASPWEDRAFT_453318 [Aspergillus wentii DTO 134E9]|uniref:Uncharacterized protein n=1 Tax=Aspergillus wentii DTO 134E9 TaxID=1073089 RepID=A0A1L9RR49_ASPWE|nr:uncharacterized protein ASPWEDRAFT_453318 [Aspergillus wentii DTO 134E9]KAI9928091.1 hypothetical protein MW887_002124 [Aspergillus wentii]OJJ37430.1 hypothetical protein ASPWEDRAFT_453318 [Aspergillus wentii DTO 134E9]
MAIDDASPQVDGTYPSPQNATSLNGNSPLARYYPLQVKPELVTTPDPFTLYFGFFGKWNWKRNVTLALVRRIESTRLVLQRNPNQDEMDAMVFLVSRNVYQHRMGAPLGGFAGAAWLYSRAKRSERYRTYVPQPQGAGGLPSPRQLLEGIKSFAIAEPAIFRQTMATSAFKMFFWMTGASIITATWAVYNDTAGTIKDSRMAEFIAAMRRQSPEELKKRKLEAVTERHREIHQQKQPQAQQEQAQEMVPEPGAFAESHEHDQGGHGSYSGENQPARLNKNENKPSTLPDRRLYGDPASEANTTNEPRVSDFFDDDDASPTAPEYRQADSSRTTGSAWERIRQQNAQTGSNPRGRQEHFRQPREQWGVQNNTGSSPEMEKQREREQAQADFDRMLDAERNMSISDTSGTDGQTKGWGKWD